MTTKQIEELIEEGQTLKLITQAFTEIASSKLKRIRNTVERNRAFFDDLTKIYGLVNLLAASKGVTPPPKNGKTLSIVLTSNYRFYGKVNNALIQFFIIQTSKISTDKLIIGKTGLEFLKGINYALTHESLTLNSDFPNDQELKSLAELVQKYTKVLVFHSKFRSVLVQDPVIADITQSQRIIDVKNKQSKEELEAYSHFILEPELKVIIDFFDAQIKALLLEQTFLESELARTASRLITMDNAQQQANEYLSDQKRNLFVVKRSINNARILEAVAAIKLVQSRT